MALVQLCISLHWGGRNENGDHRAAVPTVSKCSQQNQIGLILVNKGVKVGSNFYFSVTAIK